MKNNKIYFILFILLAVVAIVLYWTRTNSTLKKELRDFAIQDTSRVSRIFMVNKQNQSILLERNDNNSWTVNQQFQARKDAVDLILKTFKRMDVKSPVSKASFENVVKNLAATHVKVEVYNKDEKEPVKTIYIGGPTQDMYGTYMMIENSKTPFIVHIPGFSGYLTSRFFLEENDWRSQKIFKYSFNQIKSVKLENFEKPEQSFVASNLGDNNFSLLSLSNNQVINDFDTVKIKQYLGTYKRISYEQVLTEFSPEKTDSIIQSNPIYRISLTNHLDKTTTVTTWLKPGGKLLDEKGVPYKWDLERMYGRVNNDSNLVILQYFVFDPPFMDLDYFKKN